MTWLFIWGCSTRCASHAYLCLSSFKINTSHEFQDHSILKTKSYESESGEPQQKISPDPNQKANADALRVEGIKALCLPNKRKVSRSVFQHFSAEGCLYLLEGSPLKENIYVHLLTVIKPESKMPVSEMLHIAFLSKVLSFNELNVAAIFDIGIYLLLSRVSSLATQSIPVLILS